MPAFSRRELFLRFLGQPDAPGENPSPPASVPATAPEPHVSAAMDSPLQLPPLQQTILDVVTLDALFRDIRACTEVEAVLPKYAPRTQTGPESLTLEAARTRFSAGLLLGLQIRYRYQDRRWCDTLLRRPAGVSLVRICEEDVAATFQPSGASTT